MNKVKRSGKLLKAAFAVLFHEKKLLLFPLIATGLGMVVAIFFIAPIVFYPTGHPIFSAAHWSDLADKLPLNFEPTRHSSSQSVPFGNTGTIFFEKHWWVALFFAVVYFTSMFLATFSNVAFYHEIMQALGGQTVSIRRGYRFAAARWQTILMWSLFAGLVGYLINAIEKRVGFLGGIIASLIGMAWSIACIFIIPTIIRDTESANPVRLLRTSAGTLKRTWGELVIGFAGMELAFGVTTILLFFVAMLTGGLAAGALLMHFHWSEWWTVPVIFVEWILLVLSLGLISSVVNPVYRCALFVYATEGVVPEPFDKELLDSAWKVK